MCWNLLFEDLWSVSCHLFLDSNWWKHQTWTAPPNPSWIKYYLCFLIPLWSQSTCQILKILFGYLGTWDVSCKSWLRAINVFLNVYKYLMKIHRQIKPPKAQFHSFHGLLWLTVRWTLNMNTTTTIKIHSFMSCTDFFN